MMLMRMLASWLAASASDLLLMLLMRMRMNTNPDKEVFCLGSAVDDEDDAEGGMPVMVRMMWM